MKKLICLLLSASLIVSVHTPAFAQSEGTDGAQQAGSSENAQNPQPEFSISGISVETQPSPLTGEGGEVRFRISGQHLESENIFLKVERDGDPYTVVKAQSPDGFWSKLREAFTEKNVLETSTDWIRLEPSTEDAFAVYTVFLLHTATDETPEEDDGRWQVQPESAIILPKLQKQDAPTIGDSDNGNFGNGEWTSSEDDGPINDPFVSEPTSSEDTSTPSSSVPSTSSAPITPDEENWEDIPDPDPDEEDDLPAPDGDGEDGTPSVPGANVAQPDGTDHPDVTIGESDSDWIEVPDLPGNGGSSQAPDANPPSPETPKEDPSGITGVQAVTVPNPLTSSGGAVTVGIYGKNLDQANIWVKVQSRDPGSKAAIIETSKGETSRFTDSIPLPANDSSQAVEYSVCVLKSSAGKPLESDEGWMEYPQASFAVPSKEVSAPMVGEQFEVAGIQAATIPQPLTHLGGAVTFAVTGAALDTQKIWIKLEGAGEPIIKRLRGGSDVALSAQITLPENTSHKQDMIYTASLLTTQEGGTPRENDSRWRKYPEANVSVPFVPEQEAPSIKSVTWQQAPSEDGITAVFHLEGENFDKAGNSLWLKIVPVGDKDAAELVRAHSALTESTASSAPVLLPYKRGSRLERDTAKEAAYDIYALASTSGEPDIAAKGFIKYGRISPSVARGDARILHVSANPETLPSSGGPVTVLLAGENLDKLSKPEELIVKLKAQSGRENYQMQATVLDATQAAARFENLPANDSLTQSKIYDIAVYSGGNWESYGAVSVPPRLSLRIETRLDAQAQPVPLTNEGGLLRCILSGPDTENHDVYIRVQDGGAGVLKAENGVAGDFIIPPNTEYRDREIQISAYIAPSGSEMPEQDDKNFKALASVRVPAAVDSSEPAVVTRVTYQIKQEKNEKVVKAQFEGHLLQNRTLFARLNAGSTEGSALPAVKAENGECILSIPENGTSSDIVYSLEYYLSLSEKEPQGSRWSRPGTITPENQIIAQRTGNAQSAAITGVQVQTDPSPLTATGGKGKITVLGSNLDKESIYINLRCTTDPQRDQVFKADRNLSPSSASALFDIPENETEKNQVYDVYVLPASSGQPVADAAGWRKYATFLQRAASQRHMDVFTDLPQDWASQGGEITVRVEADYIGSRHIFIRPVQVGDMGNALPVVQAKKTAFGAQASIRIPENTLYEDIGYTLQVLAVQENSQPSAHAFSSKDNAGNIYYGTSSFLLPALEDGAPALEIHVETTPAPLTSDGGKAVVTASLADNSSFIGKETYIKLDGFKPVKASIALDAASAYASFTLPANVSSAYDKIYSISTITVPAGSPMPSENAAWVRQAASIRIPRSRLAQQHAPYIDGFSVSPDTVQQTGAMPEGLIRIELEGGNLLKGSNRLWIACTADGSTEYFSPSISNDGTFATYSQFVKAGVPYSFSAVLSSSGYLQIGEGGKTDQESLYLFSVAPFAQSDLDIRLKDFENVIPSSQDYVMPVTLQYHPAGNEQNTPVFIRAVEKGTGVPAADPVRALMQSNSLYQASLSFDETKAGHNYEIQASKDGENYAIIEALDGMENEIQAVETPKEFDSLTEGNFTRNSVKLSRLSSNTAIMTIGDSSDNTSSDNTSSDNTSSDSTSSDNTSSDSTSSDNTSSDNTSSDNTSSDSTSSDNTSSDNTSSDSTSSDNTSSDNTSSDNTSSDSTSSDNTSSDSTSSDNTSSDNTSSDNTSSDTSSNPNIDVVPPDDSNQSWDDQSGTGLITANDLKDAIQLSDKNDDEDIIIKVSSNFTSVTRAFFERAEDCDKDIILKADNFMWTIPKGSSMSSDIELLYNIAVDYDSKYEDEMQDIAGSKADIEPFYIKYHGKLPTRMKLTLFTGFGSGKDVWVYRYNEDDDDITRIADETTGSNGKITFYMSRCSHYFVSDRKIRSADNDWDYLYDNDDDLYGRIDKVDLDSPGKFNPSTGSKDED